MRRNITNWISNHKPLLVVAAIFLLAALYFYQDPQWNGNSRLNLTRAIVEHGSLQIDAYYSQEGWYTEDVATYQGHYYCDKAVGSSLFAVPVYFFLYKIFTAFGVHATGELLKHILTSAVLGPFFALNGVVLYLIAQKLGAGPRRALTAAIAVGLGTMLWSYSAVYYGHVMAATFLILAFYLLFSMRHAPEGPGTGRFFAAGAAMGLAFITEYTSALIIVGLLLYAAFILLQQERRVWVRLAIAGSLGAVIPLLVMFAYNYGIYGNPFDLGYAHEASDSFKQGMSAGVMGINRPRLSVLFHITFDPKFGLFWLSPVLLLAPIGYLGCLKRQAHRAEALLSIYAISVMLLMNAGYYLWWGGNVSGPRLIIPMLSFFIIPLALLPAVLDVPFIVLTLLSVGQTLIPLMSTVQMDIQFKQRFDAFFVAGRPFTGFSILYEFALPLIRRQLRHGMAPWTLGTGVGLPFWLTVPVLVLLEAVLVYLHFKTTASPREPVAPIAEPVQPAA